MKQVTVTAIRNRSPKPVEFTRQQDGEKVVIEPGGDLEGPFVYRYDETKEGPIPSPNVVWFLEDEIKWGTIEMPESG